MQRKEFSESNGFAALPITILKDSYENGEKKSLLCRSDAFRPFHRTILKSVTDVLVTEYTFTKYHYHDGVELLLVDSGSATAVVNNRSIELQTGQARCGNIP